MFLKLFISFNQKKLNQQVKKKFEIFLQNGNSMEH